ncbi:hypothetical protein [Streptomyces sp. t39]|uniref:hypothetical protein n=1 Tax=Streptomyces sp. t39 TaxID=1828156 RepID=UPI0011CD78BE|nr:hypothetical protein [Streptomyces sp. t39]TXS42913.1 hypothetical protein EAO77_35395 [Streptomyces sp. t39]
MPSNADLAALTVNLDRKADEAVRESGPGSAHAQHAQEMADIARTAATRQGVTATDLAAARRQA